MSLSTRPLPPLVPSLKNSILSISPSLSLYNPHYFHFIHLKPIYHSLFFPLHELFPFSSTRQIQSCVFYFWKMSSLFWRTGVMASGGSYRNGTTPKASSKAEKPLSVNSNIKASSSTKPKLPPTSTASAIRRSNSGAAKDDAGGSCSLDFTLKSHLHFLSLTVAEFFFLVVWDLFCFSSIRQLLREHFSSHLSYWIRFDRSSFFCLFVCLLNVDSDSYCLDFCLNGRTIKCRWVMIHCKTREVALLR